MYLQEKIDMDLYTSLLIQSPINLPLVYLTITEGRKRLVLRFRLVVGLFSNTFLIGVVIIIGEQSV